MFLDTGKAYTNLVANGTCVVSTLSVLDIPHEDQKEWCEVFVKSIASRMDIDIGWHYQGGRVKICVATRDLSNVLYIISIIKNAIFSSPNKIVMKILDIDFTDLYNGEEEQSASK